MCPRCKERERSTSSGYCAPCQRDYSREYRERTRCDGIWQKKRRLADKGITQEQHDAALVAQGGVCAICGSDYPGAYTWHIDHDHSCCPTLKACGLCFRGLLCAKCNRSLGGFNDDPAVLRRAAEYLEKTNVEVQQRVSDAGL